MVIFGGIDNLLVGTRYQSDGHNVKISNPKFLNADIRVFSRFGDELDKRFWIRHEADTITIAKLPEGAVVAMAEE